MRNEKRVVNSTATATTPTTTTAAAGGGRGGRHVPSRGRQIHKTFNNLKITILCGFITILVLRGTIGLRSSPSPSDEAQQSMMLQEVDRFIAEIRSDPLDSDNSTTTTTTSPLPYSLGPKISHWDSHRRLWLLSNNLPSTTTTTTPRVLLVTGSPPTPCDNPIGDHYLLKSIKNKIDYCRIHGIDIFYNMAYLDKELAGYWAKLPLLRRLMLSHPEVEWVWWMDSDALFTDMLFQIPFSKYADYNLVVHGYPDLLHHERSWVALNTGSFLLRNCQWSFDLLDAWAPMGPKGEVRDQAGRLLTASLKGRPAFEADDQSALIYLLLSRGELMEKVYLENSYYLHGYWGGLVDRFEEMAERYHPGLGDDRWPFVTHFVGCKPCGSYGDYPVERCLGSMERAFNFADNQVLKLYGFGHRGLSSPKLRRVRDETTSPLLSLNKFRISSTLVNLSSITSIRR